jgi:uncharacterized protein YbjT (DUF2867 family)
MDALIFGATGMVGTEVLHQCLDSDQIDKVVTIGRHATGVVHPELVEIEHQNFLDFSSMETELTQADICFYCLGVYQNQVAGLNQPIPTRWQRININRGCNRLAVDLVVHPLSTPSLQGHA